MKGSEMRCKICGATITDKPLYRNTPKGEVCTDWRCIDHVEIKPEPEVKELVKVIANAPG